MRVKGVTFLKERANHAFTFFQVHYNKPLVDITIKIKCLLFPTGMCSFYYIQISQTYCHDTRTQLSSYTKFITCKVERIANLEAIYNDAFLMQYTFFFFIIVY